MKTSTIVWVVLALIIILGGGWYYYQNYYSEAGEYAAPVGQTQTNQNPNGPDYSPNGTPGQTTTTVLQSSSSATLGTYLTALPSGMTLYAYANDTAGVSNCTGQCAVNWHAYTVAAGTLAATPGINGALGTISRADGSMQLTYNGAPLYTYVKDTTPGDTKGNGLNNVWSVVKP